MVFARIDSKSALDLDTSRVYLLEVAFGLDLEQSGAILLLALLNPMAVDGESGGVDDASIRLEAVRVLDDIGDADRLRLVLEGLEAGDRHGHQNVDSEALARKEYSLRHRLSLKEGAV